MILRRISERDDFEEIIRTVYSCDQAFVAKGHNGSEPTLEACTKDAMENISDSSNLYELSNLSGGTYGFLVMNDKIDSDIFIMEGFHFVPEFRTPEMFSKFWSIVSMKWSGRDVITGIFSSNEDALKHLKRNNFVSLFEITENGKDYTILHYQNKSRSCQS